jgi:hypothetical protein
MNDDTRFVLRSVGCVPAVLGVVAIVLGAALAATGWRYMGLALYFALVYGGAASGVGLVVLATGRRWVAFAGALLCAISAAATSVYNTGGYTPPSAPLLEDWQIIVLIIDAVGFIAGVAQALSRRRKPSALT